MKVPVDKHARMAAVRKVTHARQNAEKLAQARETAQLRLYAHLILADANIRAANREHEAAEQRRRAERSAKARQAAQARKENAERRTAEYVAQQARIARELREREEREAADAALAAERLQQLWRDRQQVLAGLAETPQRIPPSQARADATRFRVLSMNLRQQTALIVIGWDLGTMSCSVGGRLFKAGEPATVTADFLLQLISNPYMMLVEQVMRKREWQTPPAK